MGKAERISTEDRVRLAGLLRERREAMLRAREEFDQTVKEAKKAGMTNTHIAMVIGYTEAGVRKLLARRRS